MMVSFTVKIYIQSVISDNAEMRVSLVEMAQIRNC